MATIIQPRVSEILIPTTPDLCNLRILRQQCRFNVGHELILSKRARYYSRNSESDCNIPNAVHSVSFNESLTLRDFVMRIRRLGFQPAELAILLCVSLLHPTRQKYRRILCGTDFCCDSEDESIIYMFALDWNPTVNGSLLDLHHIDRKIDAFTEMLVIPL